MTAAIHCDSVSDTRAERRLGRELPLAEGLDLLAEYLAGLRLALLRQEPLPGVQTALPAWESYVRGLQDRTAQLSQELFMNSARTLAGDQRRAVIDAIQRNAANTRALADAPDDLLLAALYALTGRTGDLARHVSASAYRNG